MNFRKFFQIFSYYITPVGIIISLYFSTDRYKTALELWEYAWILLLIILFVRPLSQIFPSLRVLKKIVGMRKELGVMMFWFFMGHALYLIQAKGLLSFDKFWKVMSSPTHTLFWGILAGIIIFILGVTSNRFTMKYLKKNWKKLHKLVYLWLIFTALHIYFIAWDIVPLVMVILYFLSALLAYKRIHFFAPIKK